MKADAPINPLLALPDTDPVRGVERLREAVRILRSSLTNMRWWWA